MWRRIAPLFVLAGLVGAHDIPNDVTIQAFLKPSGNQLNLVVRVPLKAMRDVVFPLNGPGYLDLAHADPTLREAAITWIASSVELYEGEVRLVNPALVDARAALESDRSFGSYEAALAHVTGPKLPDSTQVAWDQVMLDVFFQYPIRTDESKFSFRTNLARLGLRTVTVLRFLPPNGAIRAFEFTDDPGLVRLDPGWGQAALRFVELGFEHILDGTDHLLFLACLVIPFRKFRRLIVIVTSFTVAHSITLIASAYRLGPDALWFPPLIETLIAASIVYMALENIVGANSIQRRWMIAFGFGLVHGFGFSFALQQTLQFAGSHLLVSLLSFNIGVELGQILVLAALVPILNSLFKYVVAERMGTIILSALVAHTGWHWMLERWDRLSQFPFPKPSATMFADALRWVIAFLVAGGIVWTLHQIQKRSSKSN